MYETGEGARLIASRFEGPGKIRDGGPVSNTACSSGAQYPRLAADKY